MRELLIGAVAGHTFFNLIDAFVPIAWAEAAGASLRHFLGY